LLHPAQNGCGREFACLIQQTGESKTGERTIAMADKVRLNLQVSNELNTVLEEIADSSGSSKTDVIRQALALMKVAHSAKKNGKHLGLVTDADRLDTEIIGLL
jgi:hypothetical protein